MLPLDQVVDVDYYIPGCPPSTDRIVSSIFVKRPAPNEPYGIVTRSDIRSRVFGKGVDPKGKNIKEIMTSPVVILKNVDLDVKHAAHAMADVGVIYLVIFDGGELYGFLSSTDIINAIRRELVAKAINSPVPEISGGC